MTNSTTNPRSIQIGDRFGTYTVLAEAPPKDHRRTLTCRCDCGTVRDVVARSLATGHTKGCGCRCDKPSKDDLTGQVFHYLTAIRRLPPERGGVRWLCRCICGKKVSRSPSELRRGRKSCGCMTKSLQSKAHRTHGQGYFKNRTKEYMIWCTMRRRCNSPKSPKYPLYGGRGIKVCERWNSFENFLADMGPRPSDKYGIDRIDNDGPYAAWNCRWASREEQQRNTSQNRLITHQGKTLTLVEWAEKLGMRYGTLQHRLGRLGWSEERALSEPVNAYRLKASVRGGVCKAPER